MRNQKLSAVVLVLAILFLAAPATQAGKRKAPGAGTVIAAVVSAASYKQGLAPGSIAVLYGNDISETEYQATSRPLPTRLGSTWLQVHEKNGRVHDAPLFFVSFRQVNFLIPPEVSAGECRFLLFSDSTFTYSEWFPITSTAAGLFTANSLGYGPPAGYVLRIRGDQESYEPIAAYDASKRLHQPIPIDLGPETDQVFLILFGSGFRKAGSEGPIAIFVGSEVLPVTFVGPTPGLEGLDQVNLRLPRSQAAKGEVKLLVATDNGVSNPVMISVK